MRRATALAVERSWHSPLSPLRLLFRASDQPSLYRMLGKGILAFLSALVGDERARILARANGGRAEAKKRGVKFGPKPKLAPHQEKEAVRMVHAQGLSLRAVAHHYHVGHSTIVRALERATATASLAGT